MSATCNNIQGVIALLGELNVMLERLRGEFVHGIKSPADYERATFLLDELTDGRALSRAEEKILVELEDEMLAYQRDSAQFSEQRAGFEATCTPMQLIKDLMETLGLTGSDLPEIGDKTAVSKVLSGDRPISHKMAYALAERFAMEPGAFLSTPPARAGHKETLRSSPGKEAYSYVPDASLLAHSISEPTGGEYNCATAKERGQAKKTATKK